MYDAEEKNLKENGVLSKCYYSDSNTVFRFWKIKKIQKRPLLHQQLEKIQNINYTDPLTQNTLIHAALDGTILDSNLLVQVLEELYLKGANIEEPTNDPPINLAVTNDRSEAVFWFHQKNPILLQQIHPDTHMGLAHLAVQEGSLLALMNARLIYQLSHSQQSRVQKML